MQTINIDSVTDIAFQLRWESEHASHTEGYAARNVNLWRDWLPENVHRKLIGLQSWEKASVAFEPGELFGQDSGPLTVDRKQFGLTPRNGRFYPKGRLSGIAGVFPQNMQPFRIVGLNNGHLSVNMGHPLALRPLNLSMTVGEIEAKDKERGGTSVDWVGLLTDGPGMQARWHNNPTDFFSGTPFIRRDDQDDRNFYERPRLVHHLDLTARDMVADIYRRFVKDGMQVLDLMSSWTSHLPEDVRPETVSGLGMNQTELEQNPRLTEFKVHDLNTEPRLPYADESFDVVLCTVSVEYLTRPIDIFREVARVLKAGGVFVVTFSNRWFPPKVIQVWEELHEFERVGLVMEYFLQSGVFEDLGTYSMRGLPRPDDDKYARELAYSDPVYAVWGSRK
jgi:FKBP-type peptidyl-prolyl cis-trans isomerase 2